MAKMVDWAFLKEVPGLRVKTSVEKCFPSSAGEPLNFRESSGGVYLRGLVRLATNAYLGRLSSQLDIG